MGRTVYVRKLLEKYPEIDGEILSRIHGDNVEYMHGVLYLNMNVENLRFHGRVEHEMLVKYKYVDYSNEVEHKEWYVNVGPSPVIVTWSVKNELGYPAGSQQENNHMIVHIPQGPVLRPELVKAVNTVIKITGGPCFTTNCLLIENGHTMITDRTRIILEAWDRENTIKMDVLANGKKYIDMDLSRAGFSFTNDYNEKNKRASYTIYL